MTGKRCRPGVVLGDMRIQSVRTESPGLAATATRPRFRRFGCRVAHPANCSGSGCLRPDRSRTDSGSASICIRVRLADEESRPTFSPRTFPLHTPLSTPIVRASRKSVKSGQASRRFDSFRGFRERTAWMTCRCGRACHQSRSRQDLTQRRKDAKGGGRTAIPGG